MLASSRDAFVLMVLAAAAGVGFQMQRDHTAPSTTSVAPLV